MLIVLLIIYLSGSAVAAVLFTAVLVYLYNMGTRDSLYLFKVFVKIMPEYVVLWPWVFIGRPILVRHTKRGL